MVAEAVFDKVANRHRIQAAAREAHVPYTAIWLDASPSVLRGRVAKRTVGPSDADLNVLSRQLTCDLGGIDWRRMDADRLANDIVADILKHSRNSRRC